MIPTYTYYITKAIHIHLRAYWADRGNYYYHVTPITTTLEEYYTQLNALVDADETPDVFIVSPGPNLTDYVAPGVALRWMSIWKQTAGRTPSPATLYLHSRPMTARFTRFR